MITNQDTDIKTRCVLTEKAPFWVEVLDTPMSRAWWYYHYIGLCLCVRIAYTEELSELEIVKKHTDIESTPLDTINPKDFYVVVSECSYDTAGETAGRPLILRQDCKRVHI